MQPDDKGPPGSISCWIPALKEGDRIAVEALWQRVFQPLVRVATSRLDGKLCRVAGPDDVAQQAILDFCAALARPDVDERFPRLENRAHLWKLLVCFTVRAAFDFNKKAGRQAEIVGGESALGEAGFALFAGREPCPEFSSGVADLLNMLPDDTLRRVALLRMAGHTNKEIARQIDRAETTVELKLKQIRSLWKDQEP